MIVIVDHFCLFGKSFSGKKVNKEKYIIWLAICWCILFARKNLILGVLSVVDPLYRLLNVYRVVGLSLGLVDFCVILLIHPGGLMPLCLNNLSLFF